MKTLRLCIAITGTILCLASLSSGQAKSLHGPDCGGSNHWPASMAFTQLKDAALINTDKIDSTRTTSVRISSEQIGKDLYRQVYDVLFFEKSGAKIEVIAISDASYQECSMGDVTVYVVSQKLGRS
jgi:hypothetical protein